VAWTGPILCDIVSQHVDCRDVGLALRPRSRSVLGCKPGTVVKICRSSEPDQDTITIPTAIYTHDDGANSARLLYSPSRVAF
jgi:hypothetical protein